MYSILGLGLVRSIDVNLSLFYILTPLNKFTPCPNLLIKTSLELDLTHTVFFNFMFCDI